jgi:antitoxin (DNA-binding transcriptional repressor) of toxin-antitoxin stability system
VAKLPLTLLITEIELSAEGKDGQRMKQIPVSKFKVNCSSFIKQVQKTKRAIQITRRGTVIAEIRPISSGKRTNWLGSMKGMLKIKGDIVSPVIDLEDIEALKD